REYEIGCGSCFSNCCNQ
ncbi:unnamed protein product, partial [Allacma fusca]